MPATSARLASSYWPADHREPLLDTTVGDLLRAAAAEVPGRLALVEGSTRAGRPAELDLRRAAHGRGADRAGPAGALRPG